MAAEEVQGLQQPLADDTINNQEDAGTCCICLEQFGRRDGRALITCGQCNNSVHVCCSTAATIAKCPLCRQPCDIAPSDGRLPLETLQNDFVTVSINNETGREIRLQLPQGSTVSHLAHRLAIELERNADRGADYGRLILDPSRIVIFFLGVEVACTHVLQPEHRTSLSATVKEEGWQDHIAILYRHGHEFLAETLHGELAEDNGGPERYELGACLELVVKQLLNLGPNRTMTRGGSSTDDTHEQDVEITTVLLEAKRGRKSLYDALKAEFC